MDVLYPRCAGLDVHKDNVVAGVRLAGDGSVRTEVRTFDTTTPGLLALSVWLAEEGCTHVAMEATGVYWRPVWHVLSDGEFALTLANAAHVKNVPGRKTDVADALWLADLLAHGLTRASFVLEAPTQGRQPQKTSYLQAQFQRLRHRRGPKKAICAVAASILTAAFHMLQDGTFYQDLGADHFRRISPESHANRLARQIAQLGFVCTITPAIEEAVSV